MPRRPDRPGPAENPAPDRGAGDTGRARQDEPQPRLPHERDESADSQSGTPHPVIEQAARDVAGGVVDTDRGPEADRAYQRQKAP